MKRLRPVIVLLLALVLWLPMIHKLFAQSPEKSHAVVNSIAHYQLSQLALPTSERDTAILRKTNPEWDLLGRAMVAMSLANMAMANPDTKTKHLRALDQLIAETLQEEKQHGHYYFLLPYAHRSALPRSLFVDSQISFILASRLMLAPNDNHFAELQTRVRMMQKEMQSGPILSAQSYPDECWVYDNTGALAAMRLWDSLSGEDHSAFTNQWLQQAKQSLIDQKSGLLVSSYKLNGQILDGPEGSTLWFSLHNLLLIDPEFARAQYEIARKELKKDVLGFVVAREWPKGHGRLDIDSGPVVPVIEASPGSSGLFIVAAAAFSDSDSLSGLLASLELAAFPVNPPNQQGRHYAAAGYVGNAAIGYALTFGPMWQRVSSLSTK